MIYLVGGQGFIGSAFARLLQATGEPFTLLTRENAEQYRGTSCTLLINANGNSRKYLADRDPLYDFEASVTSVARTLAWYKADHYLMLSTGDVYPDTASKDATREDQVIDPACQSRYGLHKYLAEQLVRGTHRAHTIIRMSGFVGSGLKKNPIYDMINGFPLRLHPASCLQFINVDAAARLMLLLTRRAPLNQTYNVAATGTVRLGVIHTAIGSTSPLDETAPLVTYELDTSKAAAVLDVPLPSSTEHVAAFLSAALARPIDIAASPAHLSRS